MAPLKKHLQVYKVACTIQINTNMLYYLGNLLTNAGALQVAKCG